MLTKEQIQAVADVARAGKQIGQNVLVDLLDSCVETIEHYREQASRWVADLNKSAYYPFVVKGGDRQVLIQVFTADDGAIDLVQLAYREDEWDSWSPPVTAERG